MKPNILFILIDSFNAEKFFGEKKTSKTPTIDKLIQNGTYFTQAIGVSPTTVPAISSIFTGLHPFISVNKKGKILTINENLENFVELLRNSGYHTHALVPKILSLVHLDTIFKKNIEIFDSFATLYDGVGEQILKKINSSSLDEPWLYYVHLMDIHGSATFHLSSWPKQFEDEQFGSNRYERMISAMDSWLERIFKKIDLEKTVVVITADHGSFTAYYDKDMENQNDTSNKSRETKETTSYKIAHKVLTTTPFLKPLRKSLSKKYVEKRNEKIDSKIQSHLSETDFSGLRPYEKRLLENSIRPQAKLFDEICRVPLLFSGYTFPKNKVIPYQVKNSDIFPTLLELIGITNSINSDTTSLISKINDNDKTESDIFLQSITNSDDETVVGLRNSNFKYFRKLSDRTENAFLFDLKNDPLEETNLVQTKTNLSLEFEQKLTQILEKANSFDKNNSDEDAEIEEELRKLGYI